MFKQIETKWHKTLPLTQAILCYNTRHYLNQWATTESVFSADDLF